MKAQPTNSKQQSPRDALRETVMLVHATLWKAIFTPAAEPAGPCPWEESENCVSLNGARSSIITSLRHLSPRASPLTTAFLIERFRWIEYLFGGRDYMSVAMGQEHYDPAAAESRRNDLRRIWAADCAGPVMQELNHLPVTAPNQKQQRAAYCYEQYEAGTVLKNVATAANERFPDLNRLRETSIDRLAKSFAKARGLTITERKPRNKSGKRPR